MAGLLSFPTSILKAITLFIGYLLLSMASVAAGQHEQVGTISAARLNVRSGPGLRHPVVTVLKKGTTVKVLSVAGRWVEIEAGRRRGWVKNRSKYIRLSEKTEKPDTAALSSDPNIRKAEQAAGGSAGDAADCIPAIQ